jgi:hypothetical protein
VVPSRDGPPGIYVVSAGAGSPRFLTPADFFFPKDLAFSPDDRLLVATYGFYLATIDVATGIASRIVYSQNLLSNPAWSHSGRYIAYTFYTRFYSQPPESSGIHLCDLVLGTDRPLRGADGVCDGIYAQWACGDSAIVYVDGKPRPEELVVVNLLNETRRLLLPGPLSANTHITRVQFWPADAEGEAELLARVDVPRSSIRWVVLGFPDTTSRSFPFALPSDPEMRLSPDGRRVLCRGFDPQDSVIVLFVRDLAGGPASERQLTFCAPPDSQSTRSAEDAQGGGNPKRKEGRQDEIELVASRAWVGRRGP